MSNNKNIISQIKNGMMLSCDTATLLITKGEYTHLSFADELRLKLHLMSCSFCRKFKVQSEEISFQIGEFSNTDNKKIIHKLSDEQKNRLNKSLDNQ